MTESSSSTVPATSLLADAGFSNLPNSSIQQQNIFSNNSSAFNSPLKATPTYLRELIEEKKTLQTWGNGLLQNTERLLEREIASVRERVCNIGGPSKEPLTLPEPEGEMVTLTAKVFVPVKENPEYNFVGRLLGPRGTTIKQLEHDLQCKIMVRGKGSIRNKEKEEENRNKPNWEHLNEDLHVLLSVEDYKNRAEVTLERAKRTVEAFLQQALTIPDGEDDIKKRQLMELAIMNGTYRDTSAEKDRQQQQQAALQQATLNLTAFADPAGGLLRLPTTGLPSATAVLQPTFLTAASLGMGTGGPRFFATPTTLAPGVMAGTGSTGATGMIDPTTAAFLSAGFAPTSMLNPGALYHHTAAGNLDALLQQQQMFASMNANAQDLSALAMAAAANPSSSPNMGALSPENANSLTGPMFGKANGQQKTRYNPYMR